MNGRETLRELVDTYIQEYRPDAKAELDFFKHKSLEKAVEHAALARDSEKKRFSHQRRHTPGNLTQALSRLKTILPRIKKCSDFDKLIGMIESELRDIKGLAELYWYDTALRIGAQRGIAPEHIYLHRGTRVGAGNLGLNVRARYLTISELPRELQRLAPHEIEDFLCIFKQEMLRLNPNKLFQRSAKNRAR